MNHSIYNRFLSCAFFKAHQAPSMYELSIVLYGFSPANRHRIGDAVRFGLTRLFTEQGIPDQFYNSVVIPRINGSEFKTDRNSKPITIGNQIAQSIYNGLKNEQSNISKTG